MTVTVSDFAIRSYKNFYKSCIFASMFSFLLYMFLPINLTLGSLTAGYSLLTIGIFMMLLFMIRNLTMNLNNAESIITNIFKVLSATAPMVIMLGVIIFMLFMITTYGNRISENRISDSFYKFTNISVILLFIQVYTLYSSVDNDKRFDTTGQISKLTSSMLYLFGLLTLICSLVIFTILRYFTTDG
jgi:hypothetical protein